MPSIIPNTSESKSPTVIYSLHMQQKNISLPMAILVGAIIIALAIIVARTPNTGSRPQVEEPRTQDFVELIASTKNQAQIAPVTDTDHMRGNTDAAITIVEYSDLECPFCKRFHTTLSEVVDEHNVRWVYRHYPLDSLHPQARTEALATECAAEQGMFWEYTDTLFEVTPSNRQIDLAKLPEIAGELGLNVDSFNTCMDEERYADLVQSHVEDAKQSGGRGTPYSIIIDQEGNTYSMEGAFPKEAVELFLDTLK